VSYYEYAESLIEENVEDALFYYKYSDLITGVLTLSGNCGKQSSRYVGIPPIQASSWNFDLNDINVFFVIMLTFGVIGGAVVGFLIGYLSQTQKKTPLSIRPKTENKQYPSTKIYQDINKGHISSQSNNYQFDDLPHTINDFNKRQK
jgi:hypothetical protein